MTFPKQIGISVVVLCGVLIFFELTDIDIYLQDHFFDFNAHRWVIDRQDPIKAIFFYTGIKVLIIALGVTCGVVAGLSLRVPDLKPFGYGTFLMAASIIFVPLVLSGSRNFTNVYCPKQLERYGGDKPYAKLLERYPQTFESLSPGKCFPAGHASAGFALMMGYFVFEKKKNRRVALLTGLSIGWMMGLYQMLNGAHFLSHTIASMIGAWMIILIIIGLTNRWVLRHSLGNPPDYTAPGRT